MVSPSNLKLKLLHIQAVMVQGIYLMVVKESGRIMNNLKIRKGRQLLIGIGTVVSNRTILDFAARKQKLSTIFIQLELY